MSRVIHYFRAAPWFRGTGLVELGACRLRSYSEGEALAVAKELNRRRPMIRIFHGKDFYADRLKALAGRVVIELVLPHDARPDLTSLRDHAAFAERIVFASTIPWIGRDVLARRLGPRRHPEGLMEFVGNHVAKARLDHRPLSDSPGIGLSGLQSRLARTGAAHLYEVLTSADAPALKARLERALRWVTEARLEPLHDAALVKTMIAFETLFVLDNGEPLRQTISERVAFVLGRDSAQRAAIARWVKKLYDLRSSIVHGGRNTAVSTSWCDFADRLFLLACVAVASHRSAYATNEAMRSTFDDFRWSLERSVPSVPFKPALIDAALVTAGTVEKA